MLFRLALTTLVNRSKRFICKAVADVAVDNDGRDDEKDGYSGAGGATAQVRL